ncbi:MAG TPA: Mpo1-like protein, partial [Saprospiraceae bacterium]|nr:Mpo1-like protein [Saprospiraceae bacterium]
MVLLIFAWLYYLRLSISLFVGFVIIGLLMFWGQHKLARLLTFQHYMMAMIGIFVLAWIGQFIGHNIEGKKPSFIKDLQFLLVGPAWLLHFIFEKVGIPYK